MTDAADTPVPPHVQPTRERVPLPTDAAGLPELGPAYDGALAHGLASLGLTLSPAARRGIDAQVRLLVAWNEHINLTAIRMPEAIARLHVLDALSAVSVLRDRVPSRPTMLDLGSGSGYPGLPLALALPASRLTLVDSVAKKARFLDVVAHAVRDAQVAAGQGIQAQAAHAADTAHAADAADAAIHADDAGPLVVDALATRAEQLAADHHRETWDVVTVRAVGTLAEVAELGMPLLRRGGLLVCWKRAPAASADDQPGSDALAEELREARSLVVDLGGDALEVIHVDLADLPGHRLVLVHKLRPTPRRFPRPPAERRRRLLR